MRYGWSVAAPYYQKTTGTSTGSIHIGRKESYAIEHEYGHHIESETMAFDGLPPLGDLSHSLCEIMHSECTAFTEGLAHWLGAVNAVGFSPVPDVEFFSHLSSWDAATDGRALSSLGNSWWD